MLASIKDVFTPHKNEYSIHIQRSCRGTEKAPGLQDPESSGGNRRRIPALKRSGRTGIQRGQGFNSAVASGKNIFPR